MYHKKMLYRAPFFLSLLCFPVIGQGNLLLSNGKVDSLKPSFEEGKEPMEKTNLGISEKNLQAVGKILNELLGNEYVLYTKTLNYHWNVYGIVFHDFHALFKEQYEQMLEISDLVAERARALGVRAHGTLHEFLKSSAVKEEPGVVPSAVQMIKNLLEDHETIIRLIRSNLIKIADEYTDLTTQNFLMSLSERHEKLAWMLRATARK